MAAATLLLTGGLSLAGSLTAWVCSDEHRKTEKWLRSAFQPTNIRSELGDRRIRTSALAPPPPPSPLGHLIPEAFSPPAGLSKLTKTATVGVQARVRADKPFVAELLGREAAVVQASACRMPGPPAWPPFPTSMAAPC